LLLYLFVTLIHNALMQEKLTYLAFIYLLIFVLPSYAAVNDVMPGDYYPSPAGMTTVSAYAFDRKLQGPYVAGQKLFDGTIDSRVMAIRAVRSYQIGDTTVAGVVVLPWSTSLVSPVPLAAALGNRAEGLGDLRLGLTAWVINDKVNANFLGVSGMVIAPTGKYDAQQVLNPAENRWKLVFSGGWQKDITGKFLIELSPEVVLYGDNNNYVGKNRLEQRNSYALTSYLRWRMTPAFHLHLGGQTNWGGDTRINGIEQRNPANNERLMAGMTWFLPDSQQVILRMAKDIHINNGFLTGREIALRLQQSF